MGATSLVERRPRFGNSSQLPDSALTRQTCDRQARGHSRDRRRATFAGCIEALRVIDIPDVLDGLVDAVQAGAGHSGWTLAMIGRLLPLNDG
jgi:hypothetical protein